MDRSRGAVALQMPYLRVVDLQEESEAHANDAFSNAGTASACDMVTAVTAEVACMQGSWLVRSVRPADSHLIWSCK